MLLYIHLIENQFYIINYNYLSYLFQKINSLKFKKDGMNYYSNMFKTWCDEHFNFEKPDNSFDVLSPELPAVDKSTENIEIPDIAEDSEEKTVLGQSVQPAVNKHKNVIVILDPGHGIGTQGKKSPYSMNGIKPAVEFEEWDWNRRFAKLLGDKLVKDDYNVRYTVDPKDSYDYYLTRRYKNANKIIEENPDKHCIFVSIHADAAGNGSKWYKAYGYSVYTTIGQNNSDILAEYLIDAAEEVLPKYGRKVRTDMKDGDKDYEQNFTVITGAKCPAVLIEHGFYDCVDECEWLQSELGMDVLSEVDLQGINNFTKNKWNC